MAVICPEGSKGGDRLLGHGYRVAIVIPPTAGADHVTLCVPASSGFVRLARLTAADMAARVGIATDAIEGLRLAVDELCFHLLDAVEPGVMLTLRAEGDPGTGALSVSATVPSRGPLPPLPEMADLLVRALTDAVEVGVDGDVAQFRLLLHRKD